jgi:hypothetical protein
MEPHGNDQALLMTLAGQPPGGPEEPEPDEALDDEPPPPPPPPPRSTSLTQGFGGGPPPASSPAPARAPAARPAAAPGRPAPITAADDAKRRASERAAEQQEMQQRSSEATRKLRFAEDDLGVVVTLPVELSETDVLRPYQISRVDGNAPDGLPGAVRDRLQGRALDFAVPVEFLSEVFVDNQPLSRPKFEERAAARPLGDAMVQTLEVHAPRLGVGTLVRLGGKNVFVSRRGDAPLPAELVLSLLRG